MANNQYVNKVETADGNTLMDITDTTASTGDVLQGQVFYAASGARSVGTLGTMTGATSSAAGTSGLVPQPAAGDNTKYLRGDGTWQTVSGGDSGTKIYTVTCSSAADAAVKTVVCNDIPIVSLYGNDVIEPGTRLCVRFSHSNTYREPRLSVEVNGTAYEYPVYTIPNGGVMGSYIDLVCGPSSGQWNIIGARTSDNVIFSIFVYNISSLPLTVTCPRVTSYSVCVWNNIEVNGYGGLMKSNWEISTTDGSFTITGTKSSGTFSATFVFYDLYNVDMGTTS